MRYVVTFWPTPVNRAEYEERQEAGETLQLVFDDPISASAYAIEQGWSIFMVEQIEIGVMLPR